MSTDTLTAGMDQAGDAERFPTDERAEMMVPLGGGPTESDSDDQEEGVETADLPLEVDGTEPVTSEADPDDRPLQKRRRSIDMLPIEEQAALLERERVLRECIEQRELLGTKILPRKVRQDAATKLNVNPRTIGKWLKRYEEYHAAYPDEPPINAFVDLPSGRPKQLRLTEDQQKVALYTYLKRDWLAVLEDGQVKPVKIKPTVHMVYLILKSVWPDLEVSEDSVRKFLKKKQQEDRGLFALARKGRKIFWAEYVLKKKFDFGAPNVWWISDARALPILIRNGDIICTITLLLIVDGRTRAVLGWTLIPRKVEDESGAVKRVDFTAKDVRSLLARTIYKLGCRPYIWYTDNGSQFKAIEDVLPDFTDVHDTPIEPVFGRRGSPWSRGVIEIIQGLIDRILELHPGGFVEDVDDDQSWREVWKEAQKNPEALMKLFTIERQVDTYFKHMWNRGREDGQPSRWKQWEEGKAKSLPAPAPLRLARLAGEKERGEGTISHLGLLYNKVYYVPVAAGGYKRVVDANGRKGQLSFIPLGRDELLIMACLDGKTWEEVVPREEFKPATAEHVARQMESEAYKQGQLDAYEAELMDILKREFRHDAGVTLAVRAALAEPTILPKDVADARLQETRQVEAVERKARKKASTQKLALKRRARKAGVQRKQPREELPPPPAVSDEMHVNPTSFADDPDLWG